MSLSATDSQARATRASLACLPCRSRHLKCDGKRPYCSRCTSIEKPCSYAKSRRGGLDRAALAALRESRAAGENGSHAPHQSQSPEEGSEPEILVSPPLTTELHPLPTAETSIDNVPDDAFDFEESWLSSSTVSPGALPSTPISINGDAYIDSYYRNFHAFHPCVLPRGRMESYLQNPTQYARMVPLLAVMRLIGAHYMQSQHMSQLRTTLEESLILDSSLNPFNVQCRLLYSIPLYWQGEKAEAQRQMDAAIHLARQLLLFRQEFAVDQSQGDPVMAESWRRTWWQLYIVDFFFAATTRSTPFETKDFDVSVDLPCEESEYEFGTIPPPKTLEDFDTREFAIEKPNFSSMAYLIGAIRCGSLAMAVVAKGSQDASPSEVVDSASSIIEAWLLLLPDDRKQVMTKSGDIDEMMFQAHMMINTAIVVLHRPFSDLRFYPVEAISSCSVEYPENPLEPELINIHTIRTLKAIHGQIRLLALPVRPFSHSPFVTCKVIVGTLGLLSACNFIFRGQELAVARQQIRMIIGCLGAGSEIWPQAAQNLREVQAIARNVLGIGAKSASPSVPQPVITLAEPLASNPPPILNEVRKDVNEIPPVTTWANLTDIEPEMCMWFNFNGP